MSVQSVASVAVSLPKISCVASAKHTFSHGVAEIVGKREVALRDIAAEVSRRKADGLTVETAARRLASARGGALFGWSATAESAETVAIGNLHDAIAWEDSLRAVLTDPAAMKVVRTCPIVPATATSLPLYLTDILAVDLGWKAPKAGETRGHARSGMESAAAAPRKGK